MTASGPPADPRALVVTALLSATSGCMDAVGFLGLGTAFVANMTGNLVLVGMGIAGAAGLWVVGLAFAIGGFVGGSMISSAVARRFADRSRASRTPLVVEAALLAAVAVLLALLGPLTQTSQALILLALGATMAGQAITARRLGLTGVSTVAITAALSRVASMPRWSAFRLEAGVSVSIVAMFVGAVVGALLVGVHPGLAALAGAILVSLAIPAMGSPGSRRTPRVA